MKKILSGTVAAIALIATPAVAQTNEVHYAGTALGGYTITNPQPVTVNIPFIGPITTNPGQIAGELGVALQVGTRYTAQADAPADSETATRRVNVVFRLSGRVNKDCSFYAGNDNGARDIDFGVIGVRTGNNENVNQAFDMVGPATAEIETLTAGCNFNNEVEIVKSSVNGLVNEGASDYDSDEFQANIPYRVTASWTGVDAGAGASAGEGQTLTVALNDDEASVLQGAWRSDMTINFNAPVASKALVAGRYTGTTRLTLRAL
ncbi:MAG: hypothetical protein EOP62_23155 [Sphingomonadales bacterium]|nr:MAG: hypothetical protein EOP62_23155 [Sphingomonadales bacterium]